MLMLRDESLDFRFTTFPSSLSMWISLIVLLISFVLMDSSDCKCFVAKSSVKQIFRKCRDKGPPTTIDIPFSPIKISAAKVGLGRYWNSWSCVLRNSLAIIGEDTTTVCTEPRRRYTIGPYCCAKLANVLCRFLPPWYSCSKFPTTGQGHGPGGNRILLDFLNNT